MSTIAKPAPRRTANIRSLSVVSFAHGASDFYSGIVPLAVFYVVSREGLSPAVQGLLIFVWYVTSSIVQPLFGAFSDRNGRWWFLPAAVATTTLAISCIGLVGSVPLLVLCIVVGGFGSAIMHPEAGKYAAMVSGERRASGISVFQIGGQIGYAIGPPVAGVVLSHYGGVGLLGVSLPGLAAAVLIAALMPHVDRTASAYEAPAASATAREHVDRIGISLLVTSTALRHFTTAAFATYLPNVLVGTGFSLSAAGAIVGAFLLVASLGLIAGGSLADRLGAVRVSVVTLVASAPCLAGFFLLLARGETVLGLAAPMLGGVLLAAQTAPGVALVQSMLPRSLGMALGLMNGVAFGAGSALVALVGLYIARVGPRVALLQVSLVPVFAALSFFAMRGRR